MNQLRSLALRLLPLLLIASSCSSSTPTAGETDGENVPPTSVDTWSLENAVLDAETAEELDRVPIVGLAPGVDVDEIAAIVTFQEHDVAFSVHEDEAGFYIIAPLNPAGPGTDGVIEMRLTDGTSFGPTSTLVLTGLPSSPGAGTAYAADMRTYVDDEARAAGTTFEELQATAMEDTADVLLSLKIMQELVDDGTENDLISALSQEESGLNDEEMELLDSVIAKVESGPQTQRTPPAPAAATGATEAGPAAATGATEAGPAAATGATEPGPAPAAGSPAPARVTIDPLATECISDPPTISSADDLVAALKLGVEAKRSFSGEVGELNRQMEAVLNWGTLVPEVGPVVAGFGFLLSADIIENKRLAGRYPSSLGELSATLSETDFDEDFVESGTWSNVRVIAVSDGYDSAADLLKFVIDAATAPLAGAATLVKKLNIVNAASDLTIKVSKNAAVGAVQSQLSAMRTYCPHTWDVDVTGLPYTSGRSVLDLYEVDSESRTYSPTDTGMGHLSIEIEQALFSHQEAAAVFGVDTHQSRPELSPDRIEVRSPGDYVDIDITFSHSSTDLATWIAGAGEFIIAEAETEGEVTRSLITPEAASEYPFVVTATFSAETGLFAFGPARARLEDSVVITLAQLLIDPPDASVAIAGQVQYTVTTLRGEWIEVEWSTTGGTIDKEGLFTAGDEPGLYSVTARAISGSQIEATVPVRVVEPGCLVGRWSLRSAPFFAQISALAGVGTTKYISGEYLITFDEDGGFQARRIALSLELTFEGKLMMIQIDSTESGTYVAEDDMITINETQSNAVVAVSIPGVGAVSLPVNAPNGVSGTGTYMCVDNVFEATLDGVSSTFDYLGPIPE